MLHNTKLNVLFLSFALLGLLVLAAPALAAGITVDPRNGGFDNTYTVDASGFNPGEFVSTWLGLPDRTTVALPRLTAARDGSVEFTLTPKASWPGGEYIAVAHGMSSGREYSIKFTINKPQNDNSNDDSSDNNTTTTTTAGKWTFLGHPGGLTMWYQGAHYTPGELVNAWFQSPLGNTFALPNVRADSWGNVVFSFTLTKDYIYGQYHITALGTASKHSTSNTVSFFGVMSDQATNDPITHWAPSYRFQAGGFWPGERVSIWIGFPTGVSQGQAVVTADGNGNIDYTLYIPQGWIYGGYTISAYGWNSQHLAWQRFSYFGDVNPLN